MMICTVYSHQLAFGKILELLKEMPKAQIRIGKQDDSSVIDVTLKGGLLSRSKSFRILYRERRAPSFDLPETDDSALTANLKGLYGFVKTLPAKNAKVHDLFLHKIRTLNSEFSISQEQDIKEMAELVGTFAKTFDAVLFVQPGTALSRSEGQHFLNRDLRLILDTEGNCEIDDLPVTIQAETFDSQAKVTDDQMVRKAKNETFMEQHNIKVNKNLPPVQSENATILRSSRDIAQRICVLATANRVAFGHATGEEAAAYLKRYGLWEHATPAEKEFLANPTEERKNHETWKCEGIWTLLWAVEKLHRLDFPDKMCSLNDIDPEDYPVGPDKDPNDFITAVKGTRPKSRILDAADLYYRLDWACVDARLKNQKLVFIQPGVVYERHYALNWLIRHRDQEWDCITCDT